MTDTILGLITSCVNEIIAFLATACNDGIVDLFLTADGLTDYGIFTIIVFGVSVVVFFVHRLINYFVRF